MVRLPPMRLSTAVSRAAALALLCAVGWPLQGHAQTAHATASQQLIAHAGSVDLPEAIGTDSPGAAAPQDAPLRLPPNYSPAWAVSRSPLPGKVAYYLGSTYSVRNFIEAFLIAGVPNIATPPVLPNPGDLSTNDYDNELDAYGNATQAWLDASYKETRFHVDRLAVGFATAETRQLASNLVLPIALHQQARYIPAPMNSDFGERMRNAALSIVLTRDDHGRTVPNYSKLGGTVAAAFVGKALYADAFNAPELNSGHFLTHYVGYSLLGDLATNAAHELVRAAIDPDLTMASMHGRSTEDSYYPLSAGAKFINWAHSSYSLRPFVSAALLAGLPRVVGEPVEPKPNDPATYNGYSDYQTAYDQWGMSVLTWKDTLQTSVRYTGRRFGGGLAEAESQVMLEKLVIPVLFNMDSRYIPLGSNYDAGTRLGHAFRGPFETRTDTGGHIINLPVLVGTVGAALLAKEYYYPTLGTPNLASNSVLVGTIGFNLAADILGNLKSEFSRHRGY